MSHRSQPSITDAQIDAALSAVGLQLLPHQKDMLRNYIDLLLKWNRTISLTTVVSPAEIVARHFGESMFLSTILPVENCRLADVGTGAGFPGLALKIMCPSLQVTLIESNKKKGAFLAEVARALNLTGVEILTERFEDWRATNASFDLVTARALGGFPGLLRWSQSVLKPRGHVALWIGGEDSTLVSAIPGWIWNPAVRVPDSQRRFILMGRPNPQA